MFLCPKCKSELSGFVPEKCMCGYDIPQINGIFQFTYDAPINLEGKNKYIGYEYIGENFEPVSIYQKTKERYGVYEACSDKLVEVYGTDAVVLDLGAGLGSASIPIAKAGAKVIAADISNNMLSAIIKRAYCMYDNLLCVRMNAYYLYLADNSVDVVVENAMLHLVDNPECIIHEICRVLKPNGVLIRYGSPGFQINKEQQEVNLYCNEVLNDINHHYSDALKELGYEEAWLGFGNNYENVILKFFEQPYKIMTSHVEEFTEKMKFCLHRLQTKAQSGLQHIPDNIHMQAWISTEAYATKKYGNNFRNIPSYSKYGAVLDVYNVKMLVFK